MFDRPALSPIIHHHNFRGTHFSAVFFLISKNGHKKEGGQIIELVIAFLA